ncbi:MAG: bifunctional riboflavin kinase/FAD synthetase [Hormoscilla sp.]
MCLTKSLTNAIKPTAIALGNFDGVHRGHRQVINPIFQVAESVCATVVTFDPHPQEFFTGKPRLLLTPMAEKAQQMEVLGVAQMVLLPFNRDLAQLSASEFVAKIIVQQLQAKLVTVGADFRFGSQRGGTASDLQDLASGFGVQVAIVPLQTCVEGRISSSLIRKALENGELNQANRLLGRPYSLVGVVQKGAQLGRTIGFPTANLKLPPEKFLPRQGVYRVRVSCEAIASPMLGVMNLGKRPTVDGRDRTVEVHILDWSGDLYGQTLTVSLEEFMRPEQKFASLDDLKAQILADCEAARKYK